MGIVENLFGFAEKAWITALFLWKGCGIAVGRRKLWKTLIILYFEEQFFVHTIYCVQWIEC